MIPRVPKGNEPLRIPFFSIRLLRFVVLFVVLASVEAQQVRAVEAPSVSR